MTDCVFCKIAKGEIPCSKVYEDSNTFAFLDMSPVNKGHALVIPKQHFATVLDTPDDILKNVIVSAKKVAEAIKKTLDCPGFNIAQNNFPAAGQVVHHLHFHVIPRYEDDGFEHWKGGSYSEGEMKEFADRIVKNL